VIGERLGSRRAWLAGWRSRAVNAGMISGVERSIAQRAAVLLQA